MSLRARLALALALVLAAGLALAGTLLTAALESALVGEVDDDLAARAAAVAEDVRAIGASGLNDARLAALPLEPEPTPFVDPSLYIQILGPDGRVLRSSSNLAGGRLPGSDRAVADAAAGQSRVETLAVPRGDRLRVLTVPIVDGRPIAVVRVGESLHQVDAVLRRLLGLLAAVGTAVLVGAVAATWLLVARALDPLEQIATTAERIATTGDVNVDVPKPRGRGEVARLSRSFGRMVERLRRLLELQGQLLADTSHELRNPLTVIRTNLGLLKRDLDPHTRREVADETEAEAERMSRLVADLLFLAREETALHGELQPVRLDELAHAGVERFRQRAPEHRLAVSAEPLVVRGDPDRLRQLLDNLLDNAIRYTPSGGRVAVTARRSGSDAELIVEDTGVGIAAEHLPRIFDRFYRIDPARGRATGGTGLGLAIVKRIAWAHGGRVAADSDIGRGTRFVVTLPAEPSWAAAESATLPAPFP